MVGIMTQGGPLNEELLRSILTEWLPQFFSWSDVDADDFWNAAARFERNLWVEVIQPNWTNFAPFFDLILELFCGNCLAPNGEFAGVSLEVVLGMVKHLYSRLRDDEKSLVFVQLFKIADALASLPAAKGRVFLIGINGLHHEFRTESRFLEVLDRVNQICADQHLSDMSALNRSVILHGLLRLPEVSHSDVSNCLKETLEQFLATDFVLETRGDDASAWNECMVVSLKLLNRMSPELFEACFTMCCEPLIRLIKALNADIREQIAEAMKRKLLGS
jgi:hypothetical protein